MMVPDKQPLVAVLVRLSDDNEVAPGQWYLEAGLSRLGGTNHPSSPVGF